jgi:hypothetical protein
MNKSEEKFEAEAWPHSAGASRQGRRFR